MTKNTRYRIPCTIRTFIQFYGWLSGGTVSFGSVIKTMADKLMYILDDDTQITHSVDQNYWLKRMDTQFYKQTNKNSLKVP